MELKFGGAEGSVSVPKSEEEEGKKAKWLVKEMPAVCNQMQRRRPSYT